MNFLSPTVWRIGVKSLALHPMRSLLTVLGIFIGVASVVWLLAIGEGISQKVQDQIEELGTNNIILLSKKPMEEGELNDSSMAVYGIEREDYEALLAIPTIDRALRIRDARRELYYGTQEKDIHFIGCTHDYAEVMKLEIAHGRFLRKLDYDKENNVCVISHELAEQLFPTDYPVSKIIRIRSTPYKVVGVMKPRATMAAVGSSLEKQIFSDDVYIPLTTFWRRIGDWTVSRSSGSRVSEVVQISQITFRVKETDDVLATSDAIQSIMKRRHDQEDFEVVTPLELLEQARTTRLMFMAFMGLIAAISLLVGGIGIMNIMLATVTERTREIGIRRALGAKKGDIVKQFLIETVVLSSVGGATGVIGGLLCPWTIVWLRELVESWLPSLIRDLPENVRDVTPEIVPVSIPIAFGIAVFVGIVFGLYPASRAARLDPIEALRHE